jgi:hypothetical protein
MNNPLYCVGFTGVPTFVVLLCVFHCIMLYLYCQVFLNMKGLY